MATTYELDKRLSNLENLVNYLSKQITNIKTYTDADTAGNRQSISEVTPTTYTKTAYIGDTEVEFEPSKDGNVSVFFDKSVGNYRVVKNYYARRMMVIFDNPLEEVTEVTLSIV